MVIALISLTLFLMLLLIAVRVGTRRGKVDEEAAPAPTIHASGIYSIVRRSPRRDVERCKPSAEQVRKYLEGLNEDMFGSTLTPRDKEVLCAKWSESVNRNIGIVEQGDREGVEFYYYDFPQECPVCKSHISKGQFVIRAEIYQHPRIIPPLHIGCTGLINLHHGKENLRDTTEIGMRPLFADGKPPALPHWTKTTKLPLR